MTAFKNGISWFLVTSMVFGLILGAGCAGEETPVVEESEQGHDHSEGPHGGPVVVVGDHLAHLEVIHHCGEGELTLYLLDADMAAPVEADGPLQINLKTGDGAKQLTAQGVDGSLSVFEVTDPNLAIHALDGQFVVSLAGAKYFLPMPAHQHEADAEGEQSHEGEAEADDTHEGEGEGEHTHEGEGEEDHSHDEG